MTTKLDWLGEATLQGVGAKAGWLATPQQDAWRGIQSSREAIDVEFVEDANIGHKIKIGENIEAALHVHWGPED